MPHTFNKAFDMSMKNLHPVTCPWVITIHPKFIRDEYTGGEAYGILTAGGSQGGAPMHDLPTFSAPVRCIH
jgi:hypothetical protein